VNGTNNYYEFNATLTIYINETTTVCDEGTNSRETILFTGPVSAVVTSTVIPECHNAWDIVLIVLIIVFGLLALLALLALGWFLLRRYPICDACQCRHRPGHCPLDRFGGGVTTGGLASTGFYGGQRTGQMHDMPEN
jgi:hypothetical protein